jgi:endosialidase-like protein
MASHSMCREYCRSASKTSYRLKPVTYRYKKEIDVTQGLDYGLVAEEVAAADPNLVAC